MNSDDESSNSSQYQNLSNSKRVETMNSNKNEILIDANDEVEFNEDS